MRAYRDVREEIVSGTLTCASAVAGAFERIEEGRDLNAVLSTTEQRARAKAEEVDRKIAEGNPGRLAGMIVGVKDNIAIEGEQLTCGSKILEGFTSLYSATAIERLEAEDAIIVAKTNLDEFAMGSSNENSAFGPVLNPLDRERVPGGSSGGSAAAVAGGLVQVALGSETGGSVRQPGAFTGTVGVKPTYGRVSRYGLVAFASSLDQIGPLATNVHDAALVTEIIAGEDPRDMTSSGREVGSYTEGLQDATVEGKIIGVPKEYIVEGLDPAVAAAIDELSRKIEDAGATVREISLPHTDYVIPTYYVLATAEASSNLARYDGVRYGHRSKEATTLEEMYELSRSEGFGPEVKRRIMLGTFVLSSGYYDAYYKKGQQLRTLIGQDFSTAFAEVDLILAPTAPTPAFRFGEKTEDPIAMYLSDIYTAAANIAGIPALSVPCGTDPQSGMPLGVQVMAPHFEEKRMFEGGAWIEGSR